MADNNGLFDDRQWALLALKFGLAPRQSQIARFMCAGYTYKAIAFQTGITVNTVRMHIRALYGKLEAHDRISMMLKFFAARETLPVREVG